MARRRRSRRSGNLSTADGACVVPLRPLAEELAGLISEFCRRYPNTKIAADYRSTPGVIVLGERRAPPGGAVRGRPDLLLHRRPAGLPTYRRMYSKVQAANPGRWLSYDEAYGRLLGACRDGSIVGTRDEVVMRLGLPGMRVAEIAALEVASLGQLPTMWCTRRTYPRLTTSESVVRPWSPVEAPEVPHRHGVPHGCAAGSTGPRLGVCAVGGSQVPAVSPAPVVGASGR